MKARLAEKVGQASSLSPSEDDPTLLLKRLRHFCRKNTSDYFIHKNLDGFLRRELEFYLKDQVRIWLTSTATYRRNNAHYAWSGNWPRK